MWVVLASVKTEALEPSVKQYRALMYLWAVPLATMDVNNQRVPMLDDKWRAMFDSVTTELWFWWWAWWWKSHLGCYWIAMMCIIYPWTRWFIAREELAKLKSSTLLTMYKILGKMWIENSKKWINNYTFNDVSSKFFFNNWSSIFLLALESLPSDPMFTRFGSMELSWGFIDEANECPIRWDWILISRIRYMLEEFCPYCTWKQEFSDLVREENVLNPDPTWDDDIYIEKNVYLCPHCNRENYWLLPRVLSTFNPDKWWVFTKFYYPWASWKQKDHIKFIPALVTDNKYIAKAYIANLRKMENKIDKERLLYGNFEYDNTPWRLFDYDELNNMFKKELENELLDKKIKTDPDFKKLVDIYWKCKTTGYDYKITCDPARHGRDLAVIMVWCWFSVIEIYAYHYSDMTELEDRILILQDKYNIGRYDVIVDDDWIWGGLCDSLRCRGFINRSPAIQSKKSKRDPMYRLNYASIKDQCYFELGRKVKDMAVTNENIYVFGSRVTSNWKHKNWTVTPAEVREQIIRDLDAIVEVDIDKDSPKKIINKKDLRDKIWRSSDYWDCMMLRIFREVKKKNKAFVYLRKE